MANRDWAPFEAALPGVAADIRAGNAAKGFGALPNLPDLYDTNASNGMIQDIKAARTWCEDRLDAAAIALIHGEASEMLEARRRPNWKTDPSEHVPEFTGLVEEGADVIIRVLDLFARLGLATQLAQCIPAKVAYNATRPFKHGRTF